MPIRQTTAGTTAAQIIAYNSKRKSTLLRNFSGSTAFIHDSAQGITTLGFPLQAGEFVGFTARDGDEPQLALYAQTTLGTTDLRIIESFGEIPKGGT